MPLGSEKEIGSTRDADLIVCEELLLQTLGEGAQDVTMTEVLMQRGR